ncbi:MAG: hypothetical protein ACRCVT_10140 [Leadbetterella sp.]
MKKEEIYSEFFVGEQRIHKTPRRVGGYDFAIRKAIQMNADNLTVTTQYSNGTTETLSCLPLLTKKKAAMQAKLIAPVV